jgi:hypothetical protein
VRPLGVVVADELGEDRPQVPLVDDDEVVQALAAQGRRLGRRGGASTQAWPTHHARHPLELAGPRFSAPTPSDACRAASAAIPSSRAGGSCPTSDRDRSNRRPAVSVAPARSVRFRKVRDFPLLGEPDTPNPELFPEWLTLVGVGRPASRFRLFLAAALVVLRQLIQRARLHYRWPTRPATRRLK